MPDESYGPRRALRADAVGAPEHLRDTRARGSGCTRLCAHDRAGPPGCERAAEPRRAVLLRPRQATALLLPRRSQRRWPDLAVVSGPPRRARGIREQRTG